MRFNSMFHVLTFLTVTLIFSAPFIVLAQREPSRAEIQRRRAQTQTQKPQKVLDQPETETTPELSVREQAIAQSETARTEQERAVLAAWRDAEASVSTGLWFWTGCFANFFGYLTASTYHRPIPAVPLLGKSPEYVASYTDAYRAKTSELQMANAKRGACISGVLYLIPVAVTILSTSG